jgi:hypothetical protein
LNKRSWYIIGSLLLAAACSSPIDQGDPYTPGPELRSDPPQDSLARPEPHRKVER